MNEPSPWIIYAPEGLPGDWWSLWDQLAASPGSMHPVLGSRWARHLIGHFGRDTLSYAQVSDGEGVVAMVVLERVGALRWRCFQPAQAPLPMLVFRRVGADIAESLQRLLRQLSPTALALDLACNDPHEGITPGSGALTFVDVACYGTTISVVTDSFESYWSTRPKGLRQNVGRYFRRLEREGHSWRLEVMTRPDQMEWAVREYALLESSGWKGSAGSAVLHGNQQGIFYRGLLEDFAATGNAQAFMLYVDDRIAAARLVVRGFRMAVMLKTAYDESLANYAPGRLVTYLSLRQLLDDPSIQRVEFYTKANRDALEWATEQRELQTVTVFRHVLWKSLARQRRRVLGKKDPDR